MLEKIFGRAIKDEREINAGRKVHSEGFFVLFWGLLAMILVKLYVYQRPFADWGPEWVLFMVTAIYCCIRYVMVGVPLTYRVRSMPVKIACSLGSGIGLAVVVMGMLAFGGKLTPLMVTIWSITGVATVVLTFLMLQFMDYLLARRAKKLSPEDE